MQVTLCDPSGSAPFGLPAMQQHPHYAACLHQMGTEAVAAEFRQDGTRVARAQVYARRIGPIRVFWLPRGPVWAAEPAEDAQALALGALHRAVGRRGVWIVSRDGSDGPRAPLRLAAPVRVAETDLSADAGTRRAALHPKWRNHLHRAERAGLGIEARPLRAGDDGLLNAELMQRRSRRYAALPQAFAWTWAARQPESTRLFIARAGTTPIAFMLFLLHSPVASYHIGWTGPQGRQVSAHALLLWQASSWLADNGYRRLDLGTLDPRNPGLAEFKLRSGARSRDLGATRLHWRV